MSFHVNGHPVDCEVTGDGPTIVLVPGSFSTGAAWRPVIRLLRDRFRIVTTSLPGYGGTGEIRDSVHTDIALIAEIVEAVIAAGGTKVHLVGHSFGGCVAIAVALRGRVALSGLTTFEGNALDVLRLAGEKDLYRQTQAMRTAYETTKAARWGEVAASVIDFWGGAGSFVAMPEAVRRYIQDTAATNALDWHSALGFAAPEQGYRGLACPCHFVYGGAGTLAARRMAEIMAAWVPTGRASAIEGASHFLITTHPEQTASIIAADAA